MLAEPVRVQNENRYCTTTKCGKTQTMPVTYYSNGTRTAQCPVCGSVLEESNTRLKGISFLRMRPGNDDGTGF